MPEDLFDWIVTIVLGVVAGVAMYLSTFIHWSG